MVARVPGRPKAADISTEAVLACAEHRDFSSLNFPTKVVQAKLQKLVAQGLLESGSHLPTLKGRALLEESKASYHA